MLSNVIVLLFWLQQGTYKVALDTEKNSDDIGVSIKYCSSDNYNIFYGLLVCHFLFVAFGAYISYMSLKMEPKYNLSRPLGSASVLVMITACVVALFTTLSSNSHHNKMTLMAVALIFVSGYILFWVISPAIRGNSVHDGYRAVSACSFFWLFCAVFLFLRLRCMQCHLFSCTASCVVSSK